MKLVSRLGCTIADVDALGEDARAELIDGTMVGLPRKTRLQARIAGILAMELVPAYQDGVAEWWIRTETQLGVSSRDLLCVEAAGWKQDRERKPKKYRTKHVPDWACDVLTPSTRNHVLKTKRAVYARLGLKYWWVIDPQERTLTVRKRKDGAWVKLGTYQGNAVICASPFKRVELDLAQWWPSEAPTKQEASCDMQADPPSAEPPVAPACVPAMNEGTPVDLVEAAATEQNPVIPLACEPLVPAVRPAVVIPKKAPDAISTRISDVLKIACAYEWRVARIPAAVAGWLKAKSDAAPYWVCSIVMDRQGEKRDAEARKAPGAQWWWTIDLRTRTLEVRQRRDGVWELVQRYVEGVEACVQPFDKVRFKLADWWALAGATDRMAASETSVISDQALELVERALRGASSPAASFAAGA